MKTQIQQELLAIQHMAGLLYPYQTLKKERKKNTISATTTVARIFAHSKDMHSVSVYTFHSKTFFLCQHYTCLDFVSHEYIYSISIIVVILLSIQWSEVPK